MGEKVFTVYVSDEFWNVDEIRSPWSRKNSCDVVGAKKVILIKLGDKAHGQKEELHWSSEEWLRIYLGVGESKEKGDVQKDFDMLKKTFKTLQALAAVKLKLFFSLVKYYH